MEGSGVILLDTHSLIWMDQDNAALGAMARGLIEGLAGGRGGGECHQFLGSSHA